MPKQLLLLSVLVLCFCAIVSPLMNFQSAGSTKGPREFTLSDSETFNQIDWVDILSQLPQYRKQAPIDVNSVISSSPEVEISDGIVVGIVVGEPASILLYANSMESLEPLQLQVGEGWLKGWIIEAINADTVEWVNKDSQQTYTQMLFNYSDS
jgi:hypothetical protein